MNPQQATLAFATLVLLVAVVEGLLRWSALQNIRRAERAQAEAQVAVAEATRKFEEVTALVGGILAERDQWSKRWWRAACEHGVAQQMMMTEIERLALLLRKHQVPFSPNPTLKRVADEFQARHTDPAKKASEKGGRISLEPKEARLLDAPPGSPKEIAEEPPRA